jgi:hypothetical protein
MSTYSRPLRIGVLLVSVAFFSACASTNLKSVQRAHGFEASRVRNVLVICITSTPGVRNRFESEFVRQWRARGVDAMASEDVLPVGVTMDKAGIAPLAKKQGFDSALVMRLLKRGKIDPQLAQVNSGNNPSPEDNSNMTHYVDAVVASPQYGTDFEVAVVGTNLYDVATEKLLWSGVTDTLLTGEPDKRAHQFVELILKELYRPAPK